MTSRSDIALQTTLRLLKPMVRLLLRHGVTYPAFAVALKQVFLDAAKDAIEQDGTKLTDSAVSLLSGVHRRDIRNMTRNSPLEDATQKQPMNMAMQVVGRWLSQDNLLDAFSQPIALGRTEPYGGFDALVASISSDVRPRSVLDEMLRLGIATQEHGQIRLVSPGFVPQLGFAEMMSLLAHNVHDHVAAAARNLEDKTNFLEQSIFVDHLTTESVERLHAVSSKAWKQAFKTVMQESTDLYNRDQREAPPHDRVHRARFGSYFYSEPEDHRDKNSSN